MGNDSGQMSRALQPFPHNDDGDDDDDYEDVGSSVTESWSSVIADYVVHLLFHIMDWQLSHIMLVGSCLT